MFDIRLLGKRNEPFDSWIWIVVLGQINKSPVLLVILAVPVLIRNLYNEEFDPGSG